MKLTLDRAALLKALDPASRIVERRNTIPILSNIRLVATDGALELTATDLDIELRCSLPAEVATSGATTLPAARLHDIARKLTEGAQISLEMTGETMLTLRSGRSRFQINTLEASDFPHITQGDLPCSFVLPAATLAEVIARTSFAISTEETRYYLNGIYLHALTIEGAAVLHAVATDGHRLARYRLPAPAGSAQMPGIILPKKTVDEVARLVAKAKDDVTVALSSTKIRFEVGGFVLTSKLIDGTYPDYQRVIPQGNDKLVQIASADLSASAERVATISGERGRAVKLSFSHRRLELLVTNPDAGEARDEIECDYDGSPIDIGFNARYLSESLAVIGGETVQIKLADAGSPAILQACEGGELLTVLMPMRI